MIADRTFGTKFLGGLSSPWSVKSLLVNVVLIDHLIDRSEIPPTVI
jgi:hypothetical protein